MKIPYVIRCHCHYVKLLGLSTALMLAVLVFPARAQQRSSNVPTNPPMAYSEVTTTKPADEEPSSGFMAMGWAPACA